MKRHLNRTGKGFLPVEGYEEFRHMEESGRLLEITVCAGHRCGIAKAEIERVFEEDVCEEAAVLVFFPASQHHTRV